MYKRQVSAKDCKEYLIKGSLSLIHHIGSIIEKHSFNAYEILVKELNGKHLFQGRVRDVERRTEGGWNRGIVKLEGIDDFVNRDAKIDFQNEFLVAMEGDKVLASRFSWVPKPSFGIPYLSIGILIEQRLIGHFCCDLIPFPTQGITL